MNEGEFNSNFTWFEWSFVSPEQFADQEPSMMSEQVPASFSVDLRPDVWDEENRWTT
ncbi:MAG: hypothetical protein NVSMB22_03480 [Chloroflexota bacterium]